MMVPPCSNIKEIANVIVHTSGDMRVFQPFLFGLNAVYYLRKV
jgi:hypothetical protein